MQLSWGAKVSPEFCHEVLEVSRRLGVQPNYLMAVMAFETAETFRADIRNAAGSGAVGLIQFMPGTAKLLGTSVSALMEMTPVQQLKYVEAYFEPYRGRLRTLMDVYMAVLYPAAIGKGGAFVLFKAPYIAYRQNAGLDWDKDDHITVAEATEGPSRKLVKGLAPGNVRTFI
jgi:hypothetical protein